MITIKKVNFSDHFFTEVTIQGFELNRGKIALVEVDYFKTSVRVNENKIMQQLCTQLKYYFRTLFNEICALHSDDAKPKKAALIVLEQFNQQNLTIRKTFRSEGFDTRQKREVFHAINNLRC